MSSRVVSQSIQILVDLSVLSVAHCLAFLFRFEFHLGLQTTKLLFFTLPYVVLFQYLLLGFAGVPARAWRYVGLRDTYRIAIGLGVSTAVLVGLRLGLASLTGHVLFVRIPLGVLAMDLVLAFLGIAGVRVLRRVTVERAQRRSIARPAEAKRTLLVGAGRTGALVAREISERPDLGLKLVGLADDDPMKLGTLIHGAKVLGDTHSLPKLARRHGIEQVIITMGVVSSQVVRRLVHTCEEASVPVKIVPGMSEIIDGRFNLTRVREVTIEDLLGREPVDLDIEALHDFLGGRRVLVTGAGGSIGSELCRQVVRLRPKRLILFEQAENALFAVHEELRGSCRDLDVQLVPCVGDICDAERVAAVLGEHGPDVVFHAAAHKHVPMMEWNPGEAIKNNVFGTRLLADAADRFGVSAFVMISTDKAVNPTSVMGATKRAAELYIQSMSTHSETKFVAVRFGNVLGSAGSVVPTFKSQIEAGGPVTVTHPDMQRYFMTIPEASQLVLQAAAMGEGGEIFVLDMGAPVSIVQLARDLIRLSGFSEQEIEIEFTGVRPGEKLFEELSVDTEEIAKTRHSKIFIGKIASLPRDKLLEQFDRLGGLAQAGSRAQIRAALADLVPEMTAPAEADPQGVGSSPTPPPAAARGLH